MGSSVTWGRTDRPSAAAYDAPAIAAGRWPRRSDGGAGALARPAAIVAGWMASPPHRGILLSARFTKLGVGIATRALPGGMVSTTVTADFGS